MKTKFYVAPHIPRGSGDAEYRIMMEGNSAVVATVDPSMTMDEPAELAQRIVDAMNLNPDAIL